MIKFFLKKEFSIGLDSLIILNFVYRIGTKSYLSCPLASLPTFCT